jgi:competence protein ComEA
VVAEAAVAEPAVVAVAAEPVVPAPIAAAPEETELDWEVPEPAPPPASVAVPRGSRLVSLNLASVEELARMKGLNTKLAKEIVRRRPFSSIDQLIDVRGIGKKTLDKLRTLLAL